MLRAFLAEDDPGEGVAPGVLAALEVLVADPVERDCARANCECGTRLAANNAAKP
jgi:hypothetical protein